MGGKGETEREEGECSGVSSYKDHNPTESRAPLMTSSP